MVEEGRQLLDVKRLETKEGESDEVMLRRSHCSKTRRRKISNRSC